MDRDKFIEGLGEVLTDEAVDAASEDRALLLEGLKHLERGELDEAVKVFRRAQRVCEQPFTATASVALGWCLKIEGKHGAALKTWRKLGQDNSAPVESRFMALVSASTLLEERQDEHELERVHAELEAIEPLLRFEEP